MLPETPKFWKDKGIVAFLLLPFSFLYFWGHTIKTIVSKPYESSVPVICIGGAVAGGSGKTPVLHAILKLIRGEEMFVNPVVLCRGYGGALKGPSLVDPFVHTSSDVGDEALLHARLSPTIISKDRAAGVKLADAMGADLIMMDDGLQNHTVAKALSFLVMDATYKTGNGFMLPAGPLREPFQDALKKCEAIISTNGTLQGEFLKPVLKTTMAITSTHDKTKHYFGFTGIAHPQKFYNTLEEHGFKLNGFKGFPDHHAYSNGDIENLLKMAGTAKLVTTEKDFVRIPESFKDKVDVLTIELFFDNPDHLLSIFRSA